MFEAAIAAALAGQVLCPPNLPAPPAGRTVVVGAGKAVGGDGARGRGRIGRRKAARRPRRHALRPRRRRLASGSRSSRPRIRCPTPPGESAARRILELVQGLGADDLVLCLISGGGSALLALPAPGITLEDKQALNKALLKSGANIDEMNCVRKHLSAIKGGRLARRGRAGAGRDADDLRRAGRRPVGDRLRPDGARPTTLADALAVLRALRHRCRPPSVQAHLDDSAVETPKPGDPRLRPQRDAHHRHAAGVARGGGGRGARRPAIARSSSATRSRARRARSARSWPASPARSPCTASRSPPCVLLSGGETTVTVRGSGQGRAQCRVPAVAGGRARRPARHLRASPATPTASTGPRTTPARSSRPTASTRASALGLNASDRARRQRRARLLRGARRSGGHRADADQRQRLPRRPDRRP